MLVGSFGFSGKIIIDMVWFFIMFFMAVINEEFFPSASL
jgi:hypothetical protein